MTINPWEVWFAAVRFEDSPQIKNRPVVVTSTGNIYVIALKVTSHNPRNEWGEYALQQWQSAGLDKPSTVRIGKRLRLQQSDLVYKIGKLHPQDILNIQRILAGAR